MTLKKIRLCSDELGANVICNYSKTLFCLSFGKISANIYFSQCTQRVVIQTVKRATLTGLEQTGSTSKSSQNRNWLWGKNKLETTKMDKQSDGKNKAR